jgi:hypothetical protein
MSIKQPTRNDQRGLVAIVVVSIIIILLAILTLGFSKIMDRELRQSLDRELALQANYAAESGINDARVYISKALAQKQDPSSNNCAPPTGVSPTPFVSSISGNFNKDVTGTDQLVKYSCVIIDSKPRQLIWDLSTSQSAVFKMTPDKQLSTLYVSWENALYPLDASNTVNPRPLPGDTANLKLPKEDQFTDPSDTGMARIAIYPITAGLPANPDDAVAQASNTFFMYSSGGGVASSTGDLASASYGSKGAIIGGRCNSANRTNTRYLPFTQARAYYCNAAITGLPPAPAYYVRVTSIYKPVSVAIQGQAADGSSARLGDAEAMIDVTGEGNDVLKRQQVRVPYTSSYNYPSYAVQSMDTLCKRFKVPQISVGAVDDAFVDPTVQNLQYCSFAAAAQPPPPSGNGTLTTNITIMSHPRLLARGNAHTPGLTIVANGVVVYNKVFTNIDLNQKCPSQSFHTFYSAGPPNYSSAYDIGEICDNEPLSISLAGVPGPVTSLQVRFSGDDTAYAPRHNFDQNYFEDNNIVLHSLQISGKTVTFLNYPSGRALLVPEPPVGATLPSDNLWLNWDGISNWKVQ